MGIFVNEVGYFKNSVKRATVLAPGEYKVVDKGTGKEVYCDKAFSVGLDASSGDDCYIFDFSNVSGDGSYVIESLNGEDVSDTFVISNNVYDDLMMNLIKCLHYQRCGCELKKEHVGVYTHACCHSKTSIMLEDYVNKAAAPKTFDMTGGWHDAGDFGKYISPAAVTVGHILYAFELYEDKMSMELNIPETGNGIPDCLNEVKYELDWMLKMQDENGGVYHKVTGFNHCAFQMPEDDHDQMLVYAVSSMATGDFAASMAIASRVYRKYDKEYADKTLAAARKAFDWLTKNDYVGFKNPVGSNTGEYKDSSDADERMWAAAEMLRSDPEGNTSAYQEMLEKYVFSDIPKTDFGWTDVAGFTLLSVLTDEKHLAGEKVEKVLYEALFGEADKLIDIMNNSGYELAMEPDDFVWGSNMVVTNRGILFVLAAWLLENKREAAAYTKKEVSDFIKAAQNQANYVLGRNALGRSYVTGFGEHAFKNPHNRPTASDGIDDPMPGWVSGGPFKNFMDPDALREIPKGTKPMKCHADVVGSYSTNEITIYWNSSMVLMMAGIM